jgi:hypothetical protein
MAAPRGDDGAGEAVHTTSVAEMERRRVVLPGGARRPGKGSVFARLQQHTEGATADGSGGARSGCGLSMGGVQVLRPASPSPPVRRPLPPPPVSARLFANDDDDRSRDCQNGSRGGGGGGQRVSARNEHYDDDDDDHDDVASARPSTTNKRASSAPLSRRSFDDEDYVGDVDDRLHVTAARGAFSAAASEDIEEWTVPPMTTVRDTVIGSDAQGDEAAASTCVRPCCLPMVWVW